MKNLLLTIAILTCTQKLFAQYSDDSMLVGSDIRYYHVHVPANYNGTSNLPLVLAFHGGGNLGWSNLEYYSELKLKSDSSGFLLVFPQGKKYTTSMFFGWNAGTCCYPNSTNNTDDIGFVNLLLEALIQNYNIDTNRIYACGNSAGGMFSLRLACEMSNRFAAVGISNGTQTFFNCIPQKAVPIINIHSMADSVVYFAGGIGNQSVVYGVNLISQDSLLKFWATLQGCQSIDTLNFGGDSTFTLLRAHDCSCTDVTFDSYYTTDGGHTWAGGPPTGGTPVSYQVSATNLMWDFFAAHSLHECTDTIANYNSKVLERNSLIFPNPVMNEFEIIGCQNSELSIFDLFGRKLLEQKINSNAEKIFFRPDSPGVYVLRISGVDEITEQKIIYIPL
ncbi:MAG: T9SS type A sorting domain-containing protein [Bacteroidota bacterium]